MNFTIGAIALAASIALGGWGGYKATALHYENVIYKQQVSAQIALDAANTKAANAATDYEMWKANNRPKTVTITREIARAVQADSDCSAKPLPPSVRDALTAAATDANQFVADSAVPATSATGTYDLGTGGTGLRGLASRVRGLSGAASGAR